jgi:hypothetical protein
MFNTAVGQTLSFAGLNGVGNHGYANYEFDVIKAFELSKLFNVHKDKKHEEKSTFMAVKLVM